MIRSSLILKARETSCGATPARPASSRRDSVTSPVASKLGWATLINRVRNASKSSRSCKGLFIDLFTISLISCLRRRRYGADRRMDEGASQICKKGMAPLRVKGCRERSTRGNSRPSRGDRSSDPARAQACGDFTELKPGREKRRGVARRPNRRGTVTSRPGASGRPPRPSCGSPRRSGAGDRRNRTRPRCDPVGPGRGRRRRNRSRRRRRRPRG